MTTPANTLPAAFAASPRASDFTDVVNLLAVLGEANRQLGSLKTEIEQGYLEIVSAQRDRYAKLQSTVSETEAALEVIARRNPQWFGDKKNVSTPYGAVQFRSSKELVVTDENVSVQLIKALKLEASFLRTVEVLNKEALEKLSDAELARFAIVRKAKENFKVDTDVVDLGKAVKAAEKTPRAARKAAQQAAAIVASCVVLFFAFATRTFAVEPSLTLAPAAAIVVDTSTPLAPADRAAIATTLRQLAAAEQFWADAAARRDDFAGRNDHHWRGEILSIDATFIERSTADVETLAEIFDLSALWEDLWSIYYETTETGWHYRDLRAEAHRTVADYVRTYLPPVPPQFISFTGGGSVEIGRTVTLQVAFGGTRPMTYTWTGPDGKVIPSAVTTTYTFVATSLQLSGAYTCTATNKAGSQTLAVHVQVTVPPL